MNTDEYYHRYQLERLDHKLWKDKAMRLEEELRREVRRMDWLHDQLKVTAAEAFKWPYIPQDKASWRSAIDKTWSDQIDRIIKNGHEE